MDPTKFSPRDLGKGIIYSLKINSKNIEKEETLETPLLPIIFSIDRFNAFNKVTQVDVNSANICLKSVLDENFLISGLEKINCILAW